MYYRLTSDRMMQTAYMKPTSHWSTSLIEGALLPDGLPEPFQFEMEVGVDEEGVPKPAILYDYYQEGPLMRRGFLDAVRAAGVDNLQTYRAVITEPATGRTIDDYVVANIVGLVSCANLAESQASPLADVYFFHNLVIDPKKVGDLLMFRLAESQIEVIVHERVADAIEKGEFEGVVLEPLREATA